VVDSAIHDAWEAGRAAWPGVELELDRYADFVAALALGTQVRFPSDLYLAAACVAGSPAALATFEREILLPARGKIRAIDSSDDFVDEAFQRLRESLFVGDGVRPRLTGYAGRGPLSAWVGISAVRTALRMRRTQGRSKEVLASDSDDRWASALATISTNNPELEILKQQYAAEFAVALTDAIAALEPRLRAVLRMSFVDAVSIDEIGAVYSVHRATAARWIQRACDAVFAHTREQLAHRLALSGTELDRMTALVQSQLDVSISQLLLPEDVG
jgi:RNA polymerase sigma-70 factor (ECF subfamily)